MNDPPNSSSARKESLPLSLRVECIFAHYATRAEVYPAIFSVHRAGKVHYTYFAGFVQCVF